MVGNVHAVAVTMSHIGNQSRMQSALMAIIDRLDYNIGYPDATWTSHNLSVVRRTLLRR